VQGPVQQCSGVAGVVIEDFEDQTPLVLPIGSLPINAASGDSGWKVPV